MTFFRQGDTKSKEKAHKNREGVGINQDYVGRYYKKWILGVATSLMPIAAMMGGCSMLTPKQISKSCDELAVKFLQTSHSQASENTGAFAKQVVTIENAGNITNYRWRKGTINLYKINRSGEVTTSRSIEYFMFKGGALESVETNPIILTKDQIACQYKTIHTSPIKNGAPKMDWWDSANLPDRGEEYTVTEDRDYIRWK